MEVLILGVYLEIFFFRITWSKIRVRIIHGRALYTGKYGTMLISVFKAPDVIINKIIVVVKSCYYAIQL